MTKIVIPNNKKEQLELAQNVINKHLTDGDDPPLKLIKPEDFQQVVTDGLQLNTQAEKLVKESEKIYKERDVKAKEASIMIRRARDILKVVYSDNLKKLGDYGFTVND